MSRNLTRQHRNHRKDGNVHRRDRREDAKIDIQTKMIKSRRTNFIRKPIFLNVMGVPNFLREVLCSLIDIDKLDKFGIEMWVTERTVRHERVIEVLWLMSVLFQYMKLGKFGLGNECEKHE